MLTLVVVALLQSSGFPEASSPLICNRQPDGAVVCSRGPSVARTPGRCDVSGPYRMRVCAPPANALTIRGVDENGRLIEAPPVERRTWPRVRPED